MQKTQEVSDTGSDLVSAEVMAELKISRRTLERWVKDGRLPVTKVGGFGHRRYSRTDVDSLRRGEKAS